MNDLLRERLNLTLYAGIDRNLKQICRSSKEIESANKRILKISSTPDLATIPGLMDRLRLDISTLRTEVTPYPDRQRSTNQRIPKGSPARDPQKYLTMESELILSKGEERSLRKKRRLSPRSGVKIYYMGCQLISGKVVYESECGLGLRGLDWYMIDCGDGQLFSVANEPCYTGKDGLIYSSYSQDCQNLPSKGFLHSFSFEEIPDNLFSLLPII